MTAILDFLAKPIGQFSLIDCVRAFLLFWLCRLIYDAFLESLLLLIRFIAWKTVVAKRIKEAHQKRNP